MLRNFACGKPLGLSLILSTYFFSPLVNFIVLCFIFFVLPHVNFVLSSPGQPFYRFISPLVNVFLPRAGKRFAERIKHVIGWICSKDYGPHCWYGAEADRGCFKKAMWLDLLTDFNRKAMPTWLSCDGWTRMDDQSCCGRVGVRWSCCQPSSGGVDGVQCCPRAQHPLGRLRRTHTIPQMKGRRSGKSLVGFVQQVRLLRFCRKSCRYIVHSSQESQSREGVNNCAAK